MTSRRPNKSANQRSSGTTSFPPVASTIRSGRLAHTDAAIPPSETNGVTSFENSTTPSEFEDNDVITVEAIHVPSGSPTRITYSNVKLVGTGSFGVVHSATLHVIDSDREVAIKKVLQDERYKNRELQILKEMHHVNIVTLHYYFYSTSPAKANETYLNLVQEFVPQTLSRLIKHYHHIRQAIPLAFVKLYSFQLLRGLAYIHHRNVCHRDIKPQNLLINPEQGTLKICDFGSAKVLNPSEPNVSYICSRYYRAPELIFGATHYTVLIDMWSAGCVVGELLLGRPLFPGGPGVDQLVEIIKVLGTPTPDQVLQMNPHYSEFKFPYIPGCPWEKFIRHRTNDSAFSVLRKLLVYNPKDRTTAPEILADAFFADLIFPPPGHPPNATGRLPNGRPAPQFPMDFTETEMNYLPPDLVRRIRACQRAVAESEMSLSMTDSSSNTESGRQTPTNKQTVRMRFYDTSDESIQSGRSRRPVSSGLVSNPPTAMRSSTTCLGSSRTRSVAAAASAADVRLSAAGLVCSRQPRDPSNEPAANRLSGIRDRSSAHQLVQPNTSDRLPPDTSTRRYSRNGRNLLNRHSLYSQPPKS